MTDNDDTHKFREGDIVSVQGTVDMTYQSDSYPNATDNSRVVIRLKGAHGTVNLAAPNVTLVRPHIEDGMSVYDQLTENTYEVLHVLDEDYIVGRRIGLKGAAPAILRASNLEVLPEPKEREWPGKEYGLPDPLTAPPVAPDDADIFAPPPPAPPGADPELKAMHDRARAWPDTREPEPPLGPTTLDEGYPQHPREDGPDVAKLIQDTAQLVTQTYVRRMADGSYQDAEHPTRNTLDSF